MIRTTLRRGPAEVWLPEIQSETVDMVCTDPPYKIGFMHQGWDAALPDVRVWKECIRVLKPGGFAFVMSLPRADVLSGVISELQEAGFNIAFTPLFWAYASGFPKQGEMSKAIDRRLGIKRPRRENPNSLKMRSTDGTLRFSNQAISKQAISKQAKRLRGSYAGFSPKPAVEVIVVAMKPLTEKSYVAQAIKTGKGVTFLDAARIPTAGEKWKVSHPAPRRLFGPDATLGPGSFKQNSAGRFPANLLVSDDALNDGRKTRSRPSPPHKACLSKRNFLHGITSGYQDGSLHFDNGSFSRFFDLDRWWETRSAELPANIRRVLPFIPVVKASWSERNRGLEALPMKSVQPAGFAGAIQAGHERPRTPRQNDHPTVKPIKLMSYLIILGSRPVDLVLDPFMGSGSTLVAAKMLGRNGYGIELDAHYFNLAQARLLSIPDT